ncbi:MAG TPA: ATP synthase F1 subunit gamma [Bryobacteraceae bacterium]|jgi:F-type H+-transporting ATPase subunit gamma
MPSLIDLRRRIRSVKSTQQITKALKMISAARLRKAQDRVLAARPYAAIFRQVLGDLAAAVVGDESADNPLLARRPEKRILLVLVTSDQGRAGAFNTNLIKASHQFIADHASAAVKLDLVGRKGRDYWRKHKADILAERIGISQKPTYEDAVAIAGEITERFEREETDAVYLLCNEFKSILSQKLTLTRLLPVEFPAERTSTDFIFEQPPAGMLAALLPRYVAISMYRTMLESAAAELAARMTAMDAATENAGEMIDKLTLHMNRVRQASITKELIEVVSGAAAAQE